MSPRPITLRSALLALLCSVLWGGNVVSIRAGVDSVPPMWSAFWRMLLGVVFVAGWSLRSRVPLAPAPGELGPLLILGVMFTLQIGMLNLATEMTSPAYGVVILNAYPIFANVAGHLVGARWPGLVSEERITPVRALGLALALGGIVLLAFGRPDRALAPRPLAGNALMILSSVLLGIRQVYTRWLVQRVDPARSVVWQMLLSVPLFLMIAALSEPPVVGTGVTRTALGAIAYQGVIVAGICFIVWAELLRHHSAGTLSMFSFLVPLCGIALSSWMFGESLPPGLFLGTALVLAGVAVVLRLGQPPAAGARQV